MKKRDLVLIGAVLLVAAAGFLFLSLVKKDGERAVVTVDGKEVWSHSLSEDAVYTVKSPNGSNESESKIRKQQSQRPTALIRYAESIKLSIKPGKPLSACRIKSWWKLKTEPGRKNMTESQIKEKNQ